MTLWGKYPSVFHLGRKMVVGQLRPLSKLVSYENSRPNLPAALTPQLYCDFYDNC